MLIFVFIFKFYFLVILRKCCISKMLWKLKIFVFIAIVVLADCSAKKRNPIFDDPCMKRCPTTMDLSPFCGTDDCEYPSLSYLDCFKKCRIDVQMAYIGRCNPALIDPCMKRCPTTMDLSPFCGTDSRDYPTKSYLQCFKKCDLNIGLAYEGRCNPALSDPCVKRCPITMDLSPFCGTDDYNYPSKSYLKCFKKCRLDITMAYEGECNHILSDPCVRRCPITMDLSPFCGTDGHDYPSKSYLDCFKRCCIGISKAYDGECLNSSNEASSEKWTCD